MAGRASDLLSFNKVSLLTREQTPQPRTGNIRSVNSTNPHREYQEYKLHDTYREYWEYKIHDPIREYREYKLHALPRTGNIRSINSTTPYREYQEYKLHNPAQGISGV